MIDKKNITFICSGKIFNKKKLTLKSLKSIRKYFPNSKIILSTWTDENIEGLGEYCDEIIQSTMPQNIDSACVSECSWYPKENSYNCQQISISKALENCKTKYCVKFRTDFIFKNNKFIKYYEKYLNYLNISSNIFKQKVLIYSCGTINPFVKNLPMPHHPSDLFFFGLTEDIKLIYDGRLMPKDISNYYTNHPDIKNPSLFNHLYTPEQFLWLQLLDKCCVKYYKPKNYFDINENICKETIKLFLENYIILDQPHLGFISKFDKKFKYKDKDTRFITTIKFLEFYKQYIENTNSIEKIIKEEEFFYLINCSKLSIIKHFMNIIKCFPNMFSNLLSFIYYIFYFLFMKLFLVITTFGEKNEKF